MSKLSKHHFSSAVVDENAEQISKNLRTDLNHKTGVSWGGFRMKIP